MRTHTGPALVLASLLLATGCPAPTGTGPGGPGGRSGGLALDPAACGNISTSDVGRKIAAFLHASAELDRATIELECVVRGACAKMAGELGLPADGETGPLCKRVADEVKASLEISVSQETRAVTRTTPPVCTTRIEFAAQIVAECEARAQADVQVSCSGRCGGTCNGTCEGTCQGTGGAGACNGQCDGVCHGACTGSCEGFADVQASAECKASAEIQTSLHTECTEPKVEVVYENVTIIDDARFQRARRAIEIGLPAILVAGARAGVVAKALVHWVSTVGSLARSGGKLLDELGDRGVCVVGQLAAALAASVQIQARIEVSVEVSASLSASAHAGN